MIETIYIENQIKKHHRTKQILSRFKKKVDIIYCDHYGEIFNIKSQNFRIQKNKPALVLAKKEGKKLHDIPKTFSIGGKKNYYFSHMLNCIYDCEYCFLQGKHMSAHYLLFVNYEDFFIEIKKAPLITVIFPKIRYTTNCLYDMEAAGFFKGARNFVGPEKVQCLKVVSDNKDSSILNISSKKIENWIYSKTPVINKLVNEFLKI